MYVCIRICARMRTHAYTRTYILRVRNMGSGVQTCLHGLVHDAVGVSLIVLSRIEFHAALEICKEPFVCLTKNCICTCVQLCKKLFVCLTYAYMFAVTETDSKPSVIELEDQGICIMHFVYISNWWWTYNINVYVRMLYVAHTTKMGIQVQVESILILNLCTRVYMYVHVVRPSFNKLQDGGSLISWSNGTYTPLYSKKFLWSIFSHACSWSIFSHACSWSIFSHVCSWSSFTGPFDHYTRTFYIHTFKQTNKQVCVYIYIYIYTYIHIGNSTLLLCFSKTRMQENLLRLFTEIFLWKSPFVFDIDLYHVNPHVQTVCMYLCVRISTDWPADPRALVPGERKSLKSGNNR